MDLLPTDEQEEIISTVRSQLERDFDLNALARLDGAESVVDRELWSRCAELGWFGLGLHEALGGVGYSLVEEALLFEQLGRYVTPGPFLATVLAARLAAMSGAEHLSSSILSGEVVVGLAEPDDAGGLNLDSAVEGRVRVTDHGSADLILLIGGTAEAPSAALVDAEALELRSEPSLDPLVPLAVAELAGVPVLAHLDDAAALRLRGTVLVAAQLSGIASATAEQSTQYAKDRQQFGAAIGSFQAVKHRCADMAVRAEAATTLVRYAALAVSDGMADAGFHAEAARVVAADAALGNAHVNVQNHGGIGFTWEHTAHRFVTRAQFLVRTLGDRSEHLGLLLAQPTPA